MRKHKSNMKVKEEMAQANELHDRTPDMEWAEAICKHAKGEIKKDRVKL